MQNWKKLEIEIANYLKVLLNHDYLVENFGGADSFKPDIIVTQKKTNLKTFIEVKSINSQCGQFVVLNQNNRFVFSEDNKTPESISNKIISYMNKNLRIFLNASTKGIDIDLSKEILYSWVKNYFLFKKLDLIATKIGKKIIFFNPNEIEKYFDISACYRVKRSGSRDVPRNFDYESLKNILENYIKLNNIHSEFIKIQREGTKTRLYSSNLNQLNHVKLDVGIYKIYINYTTGEKFASVKVLSNTENKNVIFSIKIKNDISKILIDNNRFINI